MSLIDKESTTNSLKIIEQAESRLYRLKEDLEKALKKGGVGSKYSTL